jgi:acyl-CoA synthetase (AMP-forming)/AMP-acid ligase II
VLPEPAARRDPASWADLLIGHQVTVRHSAPGLLDLVLDHLELTQQDLPSLRLALLGGDWFPLTMPDRLRARAPRVRFIALGGATECATIVTGKPSGGSPGFTLSRTAATISFVTTPPRSLAISRSTPTAPEPPRGTGPAAAGSGQTGPRRRREVR